MAVCQNVYLSGELVGTLANEQALILETSQGLVVIVGCSHPGIVSMLERVKQQRNREIYWVIGGFHLIDNQANDLPRSEILSVIEGVKNLGVKDAARPIAREGWPSACSRRPSATITKLRGLVGPWLFPVEPLSHRRPRSSQSATGALVLSGGECPTPHP